LRIPLQGPREAVSTHPARGRTADDDLPSRSAGVAATSQPLAQAESIKRA
jgi:hypothetical protein